MAKKKLISQRWNEDLLDQVKEISKKLDISVTDLTIKAVELILELINRNQLSSEDLFNLKDKLFEEISQNDTKFNLGNSKEPGYVLDRILWFLERYPDKLISSTYIAKNLNLPQSTVRTYLRKLEDQNDNIEIYPGRPNQVILKTDN